MKIKYIKYLSILAAFSLAFTGCSEIAAKGSNQTTISKSSQTSTGENTQTTVDESTQTTEVASAEKNTQNDDLVLLSETEYFTKRDLEDNFDTEEAIEITFSGDSITSSSVDVTIENSVATITKEGTYLLSGSLDDGYVIIDADKKDKVQLVLNGVSINSSNFASIWTWACYRKSNSRCQ